MWSCDLKENKFRLNSSYVFIAFTQLSLCISCFTTYFETPFLISSYYWLSRPWFDFWTHSILGSKRQIMLLVDCWSRRWISRWPFYSHRLSNLLKVNRRDQNSSSFLLSTGIYYRAWCYIPENLCRWSMKLYRPSKLRCITS